VRRTVATLLVVATSLLMTVPVSAAEARTAPGPTGPAADPPLAEMPAAPALDVTAALPAVPAPVTAVPPPAVPAPAVSAPAVSAPALSAPAAPAVTRAPARVVRASAPRPADLGDAAYAARLQAELCRARQIFCDLDHGGRYRTR